MNVMIGWGLFIGGLITGVLFLAGFVWALVKKDPNNNSFELSHYKAMISMFLWSIGLYIIGILTSPIIIGLFLIIGVFIWNVVRIIKGLIRASDRKGYYKK